MLKAGLGHRRGTLSKFRYSCILIQTFELIRLHFNIQWNFLRARGWDFHLPQQFNWWNRSQVTKLLQLNVRLVLKIVSVDSDVLCGRLAAVMKPDTNGGGASQGHEVGYLSFAVAEAHISTGRYSLIATYLPDSESSSDGQGYSGDGDDNVPSLWLSSWPKSYYQVDGPKEALEEIVTVASGGMLFMFLVVMAVGCVRERTVIAGLVLFGLGSGLPCWLMKTVFL